MCGLPAQQAKIDLSVEMVPSEQTEKLELMAGLGRGAPNQNPYLPPPVRDGGLITKGAKTSRFAKIVRKGPLVKHVTRLRHARSRKQADEALSV